jgi:hypothetical protein
VIEKDMMFTTAGKKRTMGIPPGGKDINGIQATEIELIDEMDPGEEYFYSFQG